MDTSCTFVNDKGEEVSYEKYLADRWNFETRFEYTGLLVSKQKFKNANGVKEERGKFSFSIICFPLKWAREKLSPIVKSTTWCVRSPHPDSKGVELKKKKIEQKIISS